ncbi:hypothetical protein Tco_0030773 [Tanacetum coccineum]
MNHQTSTVPQVIPQVAYQSPQAPTQLMTETPFVDSGFAVPVFSPGDDPIACLNKAMAFLTVVASSRQELLSATTVKEKSIWLGNALSLSDQGMLHGIPTSQAPTFIPHNAAFQTKDLDTYDSDYDDLSKSQAVLMANISNYGSDVISKVPNSKTYLNDMDNQSVHALQDFKQSLIMDYTDNEISSDSNIIPYSQYLQETQHANEKTNKEQNKESIIVELERYKERVKTFEQRLNIDLSSRDKMIDSQMDDMIREKLALKEQIDSLKQNLSKQIKEKESVLQTLAVFKNESKEKENKYMENEIDLENKIKDLDNIICKVGQSAQTRIKPTLYDGVVISNTHVAMLVIDDEETLILEEEIGLKMFEKAKDPEVIAQKISHKPIDYDKLNSLINDFEKRFTPQQDLSAEQAFWFHTLNPTIEPSYTPPVIVDAPCELPKCF